LGYVVTKNGVVDGGVLKVVGDAGVRDRDGLDARILDPASKGLSDDDLNPLCQLGSACGISHDFLLESRNGDGT
jgi:hypothetical protein